jgi:hypothetical protein
MHGLLTRLPKPTTYVEKAQSEPLKIKNDENISGESTESSSGRYINDESPEEEKVHAPESPIESPLHKLSAAAVPPLPTIINESDRQS